MTSFLNRLKIRIFVPMNKVTDIDLQWYEAVRQDNYPAFEKLFQKYYDPLCRYAQGLLADGSLAEDVVQDMFIHFWENRIKLQVKDSLRAYFYTCIRHRALKNLQKQAIEKALSENALVLTGGPGTGKTTAVNGMLAAFEENGDRVALANV